MRHFVGVYVPAGRQPGSDPLVVNKQNMLKSNDYSACRKVIAQARASNRLGRLQTGGEK
jgi:hypothetical protein